MAQEEQADSRETLPPEVEIHLPEWRERLQRTQPIAALSDEERTQLCWQLGCDIADLVPPAAEEGRRTRVLTALAEGLGCSRALVYGLMNVGAVFSGGLLSQSWSWHVAQARRLRRMGPEQREREIERLRSLPKEAARAVRSPRRSTPAEGGPLQLRIDAETAFAQLDPFDQLLFLERRLSEIDAAAVHGPTGQLLLRKILAAAARLQPLLLERPQKGAAKSGKHGPRST